MYIQCTESYRTSNNASLAVWMFHAYTEFNELIFCESPMTQWKAQGLVTKKVTEKSVRLHLGRLFLSHLRH